MLSPLRNRFGIPGVIAVIALVFAMLGGAYAASNSNEGGKATASAKKKKGPRGPRGARGPMGPQGPQGQQGQAGTNGRDGIIGLDGEEGARGKDGKQGKNGVSVVNTEFTETEGPCTEGGTKLVGTATTYACNGKQGVDGEQGEDGEPWTAGGTLPSGSTETGGWAMSNGAVKRSAFVPPSLVLGFAETAISFPIPLAAALTGTGVQSNPVGFPLESSTTVQKENCPGSVANPKAAEGFLCVYTTELANTLSATPSVVKLSDSALNGTDVSGAKIRLQAPIKGAEDPEYVYIKGYGTWAVTAP